MKKLFGYGPKKLSKKDFIQEVLQGFALAKLALRFGFLMKTPMRPGETEDQFFERLIRINYKSVTKDPRRAYKKLEAYLTKEAHISTLVNNIVTESLEGQRARLQLGLLQAGLTDSPEFRLVSYAETAEELKNLEKVIEELYGLS